jgi:insulysin
MRIDSNFILFFLSIFAAGLAGLTYSVDVVPRGVRLTFGGYNDKLQKFAAYVSKKLSADIKDILPKDETEFERYKDLVSRTYAAFDVKQPYGHCTSFSQLALYPRKFQYSNKDMRDATDETTLKDLVSYVKTLWSSGKGLALVQGNLDETEAQKLVSTIDKTLGFKTISAEEYPPQLAPLPLPPVPAKAKPTRLVISEPNPDNGNSASYVVLQSLSEDPKEHVLMELVSTIISEPFYEDLRTKQQLGYIVSSGLRSMGKTRFMGLIVQSSVASTEKLTTETLKYLDKVRPNQLQKLSKGDFAVYVKSLIDRKTEPDKQLASEATRNWGEIGSGRLQFDRVQREVAALLDLTKDDMLDFWDELYINDGRRVLITEMVPRVGPASTAAPPTTTGYKAGDVAGGDGPILGIDDIERFREDREMLMASAVDLERLA